MDISDVTAIFVNCCTLDYTRNLVKGLRRCYRELKFIIVDNGSFDRSTAWLQRLDRLEGFQVIFNQENRGHGPAMDQLIRAAETPLLLVLDSDIEVLKCGFLELMVPYFDEDPNLYLLGDKTKTPRSARDRARIELAIREGRMNVNFFRCMMRRDLYPVTRRFRHHGSFSTMEQEGARKRGLGLVDFPTRHYLRHVGNVTTKALGGYFTSIPVDPRKFRGEI
jgi:GT2 family glycosyltransferase